MATYKTPNVYVEEISTLPPSVAEASTAIPAFIGYTEKAQKNDENLSNKPTRISTLLEYESMFGGARTTEFTVEVDKDDNIKPVEPPELKYLMYYSLQMFFDNGGGELLYRLGGKLCRRTRQRGD